MGKSQELQGSVRMPNKTEIVLMQEFMCKIIWVNLGSTLPFPNDTAESQRDQKSVETMKNASKNTYQFLTNQANIIWKGLRNYIK